MSIRFEEIDWQETPIGAVSLRRRREPQFDVDVYEVKLGDEYLMSSLFTVAEVELSRLGLAAAAGTGKLDVVVGGLGLGYTAVAALAEERVGELLVVEALEAVLGWHRRGLLPLAAGITGDPRTRLVHGDFFALAAGAGFDPDRPGRRFDVVLLDVDHAPDHLLHPSHAPLYTAAGLRGLAGRLRPGGVFALWSNDPPDDTVMTNLAAAFATARSHVVSFPNHLQDRPAANTVYVATVD